MIEGEFERRWKRRPLQLQSGIQSLFNGYHSHISSKGDWGDRRRIFFDIFDGEVIRVHSSCKYTRCLYNCSSKCFGCNLGNIFVICLFA
jgi:hypothetical protein